MSSGSAIIRATTGLWLGVVAVGCTGTSPEKATDPYASDPSEMTGNEPSVNPGEGQDTATTDGDPADTGGALAPQEGSDDTGAEGDPPPTARDDDSPAEAEIEDTGSSETEEPEETAETEETEETEETAADTGSEEGDTDGDAGDTDGDAGDTDGDAEHTDGGAGHTVGDAGDPDGDAGDTGRASDSASGDAGAVAEPDDLTDTGVSSSGEDGGDFPVVHPDPVDDGAPSDPSEPASFEDTGTAPSGAGDEPGAGDAESPAPATPEPPPASDPPGDESAATESAPGDSCGDGFVIDCGLMCTLDLYVGDGICDDMSRPFGDWFACPHLEWDGGDCAPGEWPPAEPPADVGSPCGDGMVLDCSHTCHSTVWLGDGWCDDETSAYGIHFDCDTFEDDSGDCVTEP